MTILIVGLVLLLLGCLIGGTVYHLRKRGDWKKALSEIEASNEALKKSALESQSQLETGAAKDAWHRLVSDNSRDIILSYTISDDDLPLRFWEVNETALRVLGYTRDELSNLSPMDVETVRSEGGQAESRLRSAQDTLGQRDGFAVHNMQMLVRRIVREAVVEYESVYIARTGRMHAVEVKALRHDLPEQRIVVCIARDVTDRSRQALELRERDQLVRSMIHEAPVAVALLNAERKIVQAGPQLWKAFGFADEHELNRFSLIDNPFVPDQARAAMRRGEFTRFELVVDFDASMQAGLFASSRKGVGFYDVVFHNLGVDAAFHPRGYLVHAIDITALRNTEAALRARDKMLQQAQKLEAIGTFAGGIAHDFNNILTPILGYAELAMDSCDPGDQQHDFLQQIVLAGQRAKRLVEQILMFSRQTEEPGAPIHLTPIVKEIVKQMTASAPKNVEIRQALKTEQDYVLATPTQVHQILMNLCTNAMYAMREGGGVLEIRLSNFVLGRHHKSDFPHLVTTEYLRGGERRRYLRLSVRDTGTGMSPETKARIFEPFFTTKPPGSGTGMGLPVVRSIIGGLGGGLAVESEPGHGSQFHVVLPLVEEQVTTREVQEELPMAAAARILFVDNEVAIVRMATFMLKALGYEPVATAESLRALEMFRQDPNGFDLVITDQIMPEMSGSDLSRELLSIRPDIPIILCTGFSEKVTPEEIRAIGVRECLFKPVERADLQAAINRALAVRKAPAAGDVAEVNSAGAAAGPVS